jgi:carbon storage regulator CsrA
MVDFARNKPTPPAEKIPGVLSIYLGGGDDVELTVVEIRGGKVRLGFTAPREIIIDRREVFLAKRAETESEEPTP